MAPSTTTSLLHFISPILWSWVLANCCGICWKWQQQVTKGLEKLPPPRPKDWLGAKDFPKVPKMHWMLRKSESLGKHVFQGLTRVVSLSLSLSLYCNLPWSPSINSFRRQKINHGNFLQKKGTSIASRLQNQAKAQWKILPQNIARRPLDCMQSLILLGNRAECSQILMQILLSPTSVITLFLYGKLNFFWTPLVSTQTFPPSCAQQQIAAVGKRPL